jgi:AraC-like DNA-binding protein
MIQSWQSEVEAHKGYFCTFSDEFFNVGREDKHFLNTLPLFGIEGNGVLHLTRQQADYYLTLFTMMKRESENNSRYSGNIIRGHLHALLHKAHSEFQQHACLAGIPNDPRLSLVKKFTNLFIKDINVLSNHETIHLKKVGDYAREIGISQNHLNDTVRSVTGKSAGQLIKNHLIKRATMCLKYSAKSISEIAYSLGYDDPSYFARFYKRQTGRSPSDFR